MSSSAGRVGPLSTSVVVGLLLACPISAHAFSPVFTRHYVRAAGPPVVVADVFSVCDPGSAFRLIVENGPAHERRISSGSIVLNGLEVVGENDFNARVARIERPLHHIVQDNRLEVRLTSKPAGAIALAIEGDQSCGVRITSPLAGSTLTAGVVAVRGTVQAPPGANVGVTINGFAALVETGQFAGLVPVSPEVTSLTARAVDFSGELGSDTVPVAVQRADPEPQLRLDATPAGGTAPLTVGFSVSSLAPIRSIALDLDGDGSVEFTGAGLDGRTFTSPTPGSMRRRPTSPKTSGAITRPPRSSRSRTRPSWTRACRPSGATSETRWSPATWLGPPPSSIATPAPPTPTCSIVSPRRRWRISMRT
jgi:hypothetical protein